MFDLRSMLFVWCLLAGIGMTIWLIARRLGWLQLDKPFDHNVYRTWPWWALLIEVTIFVLIAFAALHVMTSMPSLPRLLAYVIAAIGSHLIIFLLQKAGLFRK